MSFTDLVVWLNWLICFTVRLFDEIDECLCFHKPLKERLIFSNIHYIILEIKNLICTISLHTTWKCLRLTHFTFIIRVVIKVFKCIDKKNQKVQELLFNFECELLPKCLVNLIWFWRSLILLSFLQLLFKLFNEQLCIWLRKFRYLISSHGCIWISSYMNPLCIKIECYHLISNNALIRRPSMLINMSPEISTNTDNIGKRSL
jgi:hypothetical protein